MFIIFDGPGPTYFLVNVVSVAVYPLNEPNPVIVNVLPISLVSCKLPGSSLPFDIAVLIAFKGYVIVALTPSKECNTPAPNPPKATAFPPDVADICITPLFENTT